MNNLAEYPTGPGACSPVYYQKGVIARALRQANEYGGALIIAATGLGKTVIGAEIALRLQAASRTNRVVLIAPNGVRENWEQQLENRNVYFKFFNIDVLFRKASQQSYHQPTQLERQLQQANHDTIIIIDEAHFYKNELLREKSKRGKSLVYERVLPAVKAGAKIFLLTATVYGTDFLNLNSLLYLLPHRFYSPKLLDEQSPWEAYNTKEFSRLPVVTVLGLPHVLKMARDRGDIDKNERTFIQFGDERRYLPKSLMLYSVHYQLFLQPEIQAAFDCRCFDQASKSPQTWFDDETMALRQSATDTVYNSSLVSWLSSPIAMAYSIEKNLFTSSNTEQVEDASQLSLNVQEQPTNNVHDQDYQSFKVIDVQARSYDPPEGADELFQLAGRVLRMTANPERRVYFYTLLPSIANRRDGFSRVQNDIREKFNRITHRHNKSKGILGSGIMTEDHSQITLDSDSNLDVEQLTKDSEFLKDIGGLGAESMMSHVAVLEQYRSRAEELPECLLSARNYSKSQPRIFVLLKHESYYHPILFNLSNKKLEKQDELAILDLIACTETEPRAAIHAAEIEKLANQAVRTWCDIENISIDQVSKICGLYLNPLEKVAGINHLLDGT